MDSATREQVFAAKDRLQQLTQVTKEDLQWEAAEDRREEREREDKAKLKAINKAKIQAEKEKSTQEKKNKEEEKYLKQHNKTVTRVLNQAAKTSNAKVSSSDEEEEEENGNEDSEDQSASDDSQSQVGESQYQTLKVMDSEKGSKGDKGKEKADNPTNTYQRGKC